MKLSRSTKILFYSIFGMLYGTGCILAIYLYQQENSKNGARVLKFHGILSPLFFILFGFMVASHILPGLKQRKLKVTGIWNLIFMSVIMLTVPGIYYIVNESLRNLVVQIHTLVGLAIAGPLLIHIRGRYKK